MGITKRVRKTDGIPTYYIDFRDREGRRIREVAGTTKTQAKKLLTRRLGDVRAGTYVNAREAKKAAERAAGPTFAEFAARFLKDYGGQRRSDYYSDALTGNGPIMRHFGKLHVRAISETNLDEFRRDRSAAVSASTVRKNLTVLGTIFKMAKRWKVIDFNPAADLEKPGEPKNKTRWLTLEEWRQVEASAAPWLRPLLTFAVATGMRLGEITGLCWDDVDRKTNLLHVSMDTKTGARAIPTSEAARTVLDAQVRHVRSRFVFVDSAGQPYHTRERRNTISKRTRQIMEAAGIEGATFHSLRHTAASWMVHAGRPLLEVKEILGHATMQTTLRYAHLQPEHLRASIAALDDALSGEMDTQMDTRTFEGAHAEKGIPQVHTKARVTVVGR